MKTLGKNNKYNNVIDMLLFYHQIVLDSEIDLIKVINFELSNRKKSKKVSKLLKIYPHYVNQVVHKYTDNLHANFIASLIIEHGLRMQDFPLVLQRMEKSCVRYIIASNEWFRVEEKLASKPRLLGYACEDMLFKKRYNEVFSID